MARMRCPHWPAVGGPPAGARHHGERRLALRGIGVAVLAAIGARPASAVTAVDPIEQPAVPGPAAFAARALALRRLAIERGDQPYGAVVVRGDRIVGLGVSAVVTSGDPTAHAEMQAIRDAARRLGTRDLAGCELYGSARACPMCEAAAYWARIDRLRHGDDATDDGPPRLR